MELFGLPQTMVFIDTCLPIDKANSLKPQVQSDSYILPTLSLCSVSFEI